MPITSIEQRQIEIPSHVSRAEELDIAALGYIRGLMQRIKEPFYFVEPSGRKVRRVKIENIGRRYITLNYVRDEDEQLITRLISAAERQLELL